MCACLCRDRLTDEVSRENWEKWGNPDGPQAASFGIALPAWIVEKQNSLWVLAAYMGVFMVILPIIVVSSLNVLSWYSRRYSRTSVIWTSIIQHLDYPAWQINDIHNILMCVK